MTAIAALARKRSCAIQRGEVICRTLNALEAPVTALSLTLLPLLLVSVDTAPASGTDLLLLVQGGDCYAVGEAVAAQNGGTLASASEAQQNGASVCQIIVVIPGQNGERPRRMEIIVPKG
jgi:hypothetical protein